MQLNLNDREAFGKVKAHSDENSCNSLIHMGCWGTFSDYFFMRRMSSEDATGGQVDLQHRGDAKKGVSIPEMLECGSEWKP